MYKRPAASELDNHWREDALSAISNTEGGGFLDTGGPKQQRLAAAELKEKWQSLQDIKNTSSTMTFFLGSVILVNLVLFFMNL